MSDERMDERLRDYAARWTAAHAVPADMPVLREERGRSWVPYVAAASVVALVAGIAYAVAPRRDEARPPVASGSPSVSASTSATPSARPCGESDVLGVPHLDKDLLQKTGSPVSGWLDLSAVNGPCVIPRAPRLEILGDDLRDLGVRYDFRGPDGPVTLTSRPRRLDLYWTPRFCAETSILVMRVTAGRSVFRQPLERRTVPDCEATVGPGLPDNVLTARWVARRCGPGDWQVVSASVASRRELVVVSAVIRNVSTDVCDPNEKPSLDVTAADGRAVRLGNSITLEARTDPGALPGTELRAEVTWMAYCGRDLGAYSLALHLAGGPLPLSLADDARPVPPCPGTLDGDVDGTSTSGWLTPAS